MFFKKAKRKMIGLKEYNSLDEIVKHLDSYISQLNFELRKSKDLEKTYQNKYTEALSDLNFKASRQAIEESQAELVKGLDIEVKIEFLETCSNLFKRIPSSTFIESKEPLIELMDQILDLKNISHQTGRQFILRKLIKFVPDTNNCVRDEGTYDSKNSELEVESILNEIQGKKKKKKDINQEINEIIEEIKKK